MLFVIDKPKLQSVISFVRDDRTKASRGLAGPFMRLEANDNYVKLDGLEVSAKIPATVYEPGVLFLKVTLFRRLLIDRIRMPLESNEMLLYANPDQAPQVHPAFRLSPPVSKSKPEFRQLSLWDESENAMQDGGS